ncbi:MAG TPA: lytic transglycosylase domain-containing protein [Terriglobales bacterium]|nr:lytic transglycosylase domain-containing protein [Terriglobales bacterium]
MPKFPKVALMVALPTLLSVIPRARAQAIMSVEENGRKVYVNDLAAVPTRPATSARASRKYTLMYWSQTEQRWKPVPLASRTTMRAARTAAAEVSQYLGMSGVPVRTPSADAKATNANNGAVTPAPEMVAASTPAPIVSTATVKPASAPALTASAPKRTVSAADLDAAIEAAAARHHVDPNLVRAVIKVESNFNPRAVSRKGALGLMQLMPATARELNVANPFDPEQNLDGGVRHLRALLENFGGDVPKSLAAYNAGAGAVARNKGVPPYRETRDYVKRITQLYGEGAPLGNFSSGAIHVSRGPDGVLSISNTD